MADEEDYRKLIQTYKLRLTILGERFSSELKSRDKEIEIYRSQIDYLQKLVITLSERPIINHNTLEAKAVIDQSKSETRSINFNAPIEGVRYVEGDNHYNTSLQPKQTLAEAAAEIQQLLNQLSQSYPSTTESEQKVVAAKAIEEIEKRYQLKQRIVGALQSGGVETLRELVDNPIINILLAALEGWKSA
jgi:cysteinyl-tRNA synthetase